METTTTARHLPTGSIVQPGVKKKKQEAAAAAAGEEEEEEPERKNEKLQSK